MEVKAVLDTSAYSNFILDKHNLHHYINRNSSLYIPVIVLGELKSGFLNGTKQKINEDFLADFLDSSNVTILDVSEKTTQIYAEISLQLRRAGTPIGTNDIWIAAICIENDLPLLTLDADFSRVKNLKCIALN
jgi:predicted nucleic acid-binding protein